MRMVELPTAIWTTAANGKPSVPEPSGNVRAFSPQVIYVEASQSYSDYTFLRYFGGEDWIAAEFKSVVDLVEEGLGGKLVKLPHAEFVQTKDKQMYRPVDTGRIRAYNPLVVKLDPALDNPGYCCLWYSGGQGWIAHSYESTVEKLNDVLRQNFTPPT